MKTKTFNPLDYPVFFADPLRLDYVSAWVEHIPFAMFLVDILRPRIFVELGTQTGVSYSAFCQAVKQLEINTRCYAVDTWRGDKHAGFYGSEILDELRKHHDPLYGEFSELLQKEFDQAVTSFSDGSIDLLHIDGLHTYDAVKHDFETWLPKLSSRAVVLFHDTHVYEREFGVWNLWEELKQQYPHFEFAHGNGLGVLYVGTDPLDSLDTLKYLVSLPEVEAKRIRDFFSMLGSRLFTQARKEHEKSEIRQQVQAVASQLHTVTAQLILKENEMNQILESRSWKFVQILQNIKLTLIPIDSKREKLVYSFFQGLRSLLEQGIGGVLPKGMRKIKQLRSRRNKFPDGSDVTSSAANSDPEVYVPQTPESIDPDKVPVKLIAFYLPQFHPIPENDVWWGKGFTEWTNVSKALPNYHGHNQPRLPGELGFYDLRLPEIQQRQVELAKKYGIYGFCFYYYWFAGKRLLERPLDQYIANPRLDLPFCLCWANENWTRRWDGDEHEILIAQEYSEAQYLQFIRDISPNFSDPRYLRIDGKPILLVYRINLLPDPKKAADVWRDECRKSGVGEIYLVAVQSFGITDPRPFGFDAAVEFPPSMLIEAEVSRSSVKMTNPRFAGQIFDYNIAARLMMEKEHGDYTVYKTVFPSWDNTARRQDDSHIFINSSPAAYKEWLRKVVKYSQHVLPEDKRFVFVNAWNEWAEGAYLEPDKKYGYAYLQATADALADPASDQENLETKENQDPMPSPVMEHDTAVILHLYYPELWDEIRSYLSNLEDEFDLFITIPHTVIFPYQQILREFPKARIYQFPNRGRDIAPFLRVFTTHIYPQGYKYVLKLHTKRSLHRQDGNHWRRDLLEKLVGSPELIQQVKMVLQNQKDVGIVAPVGHVLPSSVYWGQNEKNVRKLASWANIPFDDRIFPFVAGSMFWFKPSAFSPITQLEISQDDFGPEKGQVDGTLAHAFERFFGLLMLQTGYRIVELEKSGTVKTSPPQNQPEYQFTAESNFHQSSEDGDAA